MRNRLVPKLMTDLCLEVESRLCQQLRCIQRSLSWKPSEIEAWFQRTTNRKWHIGYQMVTSRMTSRDPAGQTRDANMLFSVVSRKRREIETPF